LFASCRMSMHALHMDREKPLWDKGCCRMRMHALHREHLFGNTCSVDPPCLTNVCSGQACQEVDLVGTCVRM